MIDIDEVYENAPAVAEAIKGLTWHNARVKHVMVGYEDHGLLTVSILFEGDGWGQGFHNRSLGQGDAFRNYVEGWLKISELESSVGTMVRVGKNGDTFHADLVAVRPILNSSPVFWPGGEPDRFYVFDFLGEVMKRGRG